jgi:hypothetical protein
MRGFTLQPNPPVAGQPLEVRYEGTKTEVEWWVDGGDVTKKTIPPRTFTIKQVPSGRFLILSDGTDLAISFPIEELR